MGVRTDGLVLTINKDPKSEVGFRIIEVLRNSPLERMIRFSFEYLEAGQVGWRPVLVIEGCEVEAFVLLESFVGYHLRNKVSHLTSKLKYIQTYPNGEEQVLFLTFPTLGFLL